MADETKTHKKRAEWIRERCSALKQTNTAVNYIRWEQKRNGKMIIWDSFCSDLFGFFFSLFVWSIEVMIQHSNSKFGKNYLYFDR